VASVLLSVSVASAQRYCSPIGELRQVVDTEGRSGYIDRKGKVVLAPEQLPELLVYAYDFSDGLAAIAVNDPANARAGYVAGITKFGFIDTTGKFVIEPEFDITYTFCSGLAYIEKGAFQGYIDKSGTVVIDLQLDCNVPILKEPLLSRCTRRTAVHETVGEESEGLTAMSDGKPGRDSKYGFVDGQGRMVIKPRFTPDFDHHGFMWNLGKFVEGRARVKLDGLFGFIDKKGNQVIPAKFTTANNFSEGLAFVVAKNGESGYIDKNGRWAIKPNGWQSGNDFNEGLAPVSVKSSSRPEPFWGYIDRRGKIVIKPRFDKALEFRNGVASVYELTPFENVWWSSRFGLIDRTGKYVWKPNSNFPRSIEKPERSTR